MVARIDTGTRLEQVAEALRRGPPDRERRARCSSRAFFAASPYPLFLVRRRPVPAACDDTSGARLPHDGAAPPRREKRGEAWEPFAQKQSFGVFGRLMLSVPPIAPTAHFPRICASGKIFVSRLETHGRGAAIRLNRVLAARKIKRAFNSLSVMN